MSNSNHSFVADRRRRFGEWRASRPLLGGLLLILGSMFMFWVVLSYAISQTFIGGSLTAYLGVIAASSVFLVGLLVLKMPEYSTIFGYFGVALSIASLMGSLGGLFVGMILGIIGSCLCIAWVPEEEAQKLDWETEEADSTDTTDAAETAEEESDGGAVATFIEKWR